MPCACNRRNVRARSGFLKISPGFGAVPLTYQVLTESRSSCVQQPRSGNASGRIQSCAMRSETGKPFSAYWTAGSSNCLKVIVPKRLSTSCQPQAAPGTVTGRIPCTGIPDAGPPVLRIPVIAELVEPLDRSPRGSRTARVQHIDLALLGDVDDGKEIAAHAFHHG